MGRARLILISLVALVVALGAAFLARSMATPRTPKVVIAAAPAPPPEPKVRVLVAKRELAVGDRIAPEMLEWKPWPVDGLNKAYVTDGTDATVAPTDDKGKAVLAAASAADAAKTAVTGPNLDRMSAYLGAVVRQPILAGEPIVDQKVVRAGAGGVLAVTLSPGMRAMSLTMSPDAAAGGFIIPGDHVDVVQIQRGAAGVKAATVMKNIRVLAIDQSTGPDPKHAATQVGSSATVELSPAQAEDMVLARAQGELTLVLRSYADASGPTQVGDLRRTSVEDPIVKVFRNGQSTDVKVPR